MPQAKAGDWILCPKCKNMVGHFGRDCDDYRRISKHAYAACRNPDIFTITKLRSDATRHGCEDCQIDVLRSVGDCWEVTGIVSP